MAQKSKAAASTMTTVPALGFGVIVLLAIVQVCGCWRSNHEATLEVTYIANEGFMISMGSTKVLIDALSQSEYYASPSDTMVARLMGDVPPFDRIGYMLVTHDHHDHFNTELTSQFLLKHPAAQFIASSGTCSKLAADNIASRQQTGVDLEIGQHQTIGGEEAEVVALRLAHGANPDINNLAFVVCANGYSIVHVGDARISPNEEYLRTIDWSSHNVDLLFIEYFDQSSETQSIIETMIKPKHVILMHIPPSEEERVKRETAEMRPRSTVFCKEGEMRRFDEVGDVESPNQGRQ